MNRATTMTSVVRHKPLDIADIPRPEVAGHQHTGSSKVGADLRAAPSVKMRWTHHTGPRILRNATSGFTITEVLIASSLGTMVAAAVMTVYLWSAEQASVCAKVGWSQIEAMKSADKLTTYIRNASNIVSIDEVEGTWVRLAFPGNTNVVRLAYSNDTSKLRDGRLYLTRTNRTEVIVARGMTEIQDSRGYTTEVFTKIRKNALQISYRVSEPTGPDTRACDDAAYAAQVHFIVCLRNAPQ